MAVLAVLVQPWPDRAATILADVYMELLLNRDDYLRALRFFTFMKHLFELSILTCFV